MFRKCSEEDYEILMDFLKIDAVLNTFCIADIEIYGFDKTFQTIYIDQEDKGNCKSVVLIFYNNLILVGEVNEMDYAFLLSLLDGDINNIMGEAQLVEGLLEKLRENRSCNVSYLKKQMYTLANVGKCEKVFKTRVANIEDVDNIYDFLMSHNEIKHLYQNKDMIVNRIKSGEGVHLIVENEGAIIGHANSAASTDFSAMIGGVAVAPEFRRQGVAKSVVSDVCRYIINESKIPCLFAGEELNDNLYVSLGFVPYKKWGALGI